MTKRFDFDHVFFFLFDLVLNCGLGWLLYRELHRGQYAWGITFAFIVILGRIDSVWNKLHFLERDGR